MGNNRLHSLDFMKLLAALFITNSHFIPLYKDINTSLATLGVHGNALFFFVSGYLLMLGFDKRTVAFVDWYKNKIRRLWPAVFLWIVISAVIWSTPLSVGKLCLADGYWFIQSIMIDFALFYFFVNNSVLCLGGGKNNVLRWLFVLSLTISVGYFFLMPVAEGSPYHTDWHFICHFSIMVLGAWVYQRRERIDKVRHSKADLFLLLVSFVAYFLILKVGKGQTGVRYYLQIVSLLPLHTFCYYMFKVASGRWPERLFRFPVLGRLCTLISCLTLEIYIVQFMLITDRFNALFPFNTIVVMSGIVGVAYLLKVLVSLFLQVMSSEPFSMKAAIKVS